MAKKRTSTKIRTTRKKGKYPKKPKKPKVSASAQTWVRFDERHKLWEQKCRAIDAEKKRKESLISKYLGY